MPGAIYSSVVSTSFALSGTVDDFDEAARLAFRTGLAQLIFNLYTADPSEIVITSVSAGSITVGVQIIIPNTFIATKVAEVLSTTEDNDISQLTGQTIESKGTATLTALEISAPSPPPPLQPPPPAPSAPPPLVPILFLISLVAAAALFIAAYVRRVLGFRLVVEQVPVTLNGVRLEG